MYCRNCGKEVNDQAAVCVACGVPVGTGKAYCQACGAESAPDAEVCTKCGVRLSGPVAGAEAKSKMAAGLLGIFLGWLGIHRFYLGFTTIAVIQLVLGLAGFLTCGITSAISGIWGIIDGIMILTGSINTDAAGNPLKD